MFNIYCYDIPQDDDESGGGDKKKGRKKRKEGKYKVMIAQYVDDVALLWSRKQLKHCTNHLNYFIAVLYDWYNKWRFKLNEAKSVTVCFFRKSATLDHRVL